MRMTQKRVTLRDVAIAAGVSVGTASQALNGNVLTRPDTRQKVIEVAQALNYVPNQHATRLLRGRSECIVIAFSGLGPTTTGPSFYALVVRGITSVLEDRGYVIRFLQLDNILSDIGRGRRRPLSPQDADGLIVLNWQESAVMDRLVGIGIPVVAVDVSGAYPGLLTVDNDDRGCVAMGIDYLVRLGHRHIALVNLPLHHPFGREAFAGYLEAFTQHGLTVEPWLLQTTSDTSITAGRLVMNELLTGGQSVTAVFTVTDELAVGAMQAISESGRRVPDDISIVSMDDIPLAAETRPALTTVRVDLEALGRLGIEMLLDVVEEQHLVPAHVLVTTQRLIVRDSATPPVLSTAT